MLKYIILFTLIISLNATNNVFHGTYSNLWTDCSNWSLQKCPNMNDTVIINNKYVFLNKSLYITINDMLLFNSKLLINNACMNISNYLDNNNSTIIITNSTIYIWNKFNTIKTGNLYLYNSSFIPNGNLIVDKYLLLSKTILIPTNIYIYGIVEFLPNTQLYMGYSFNITQYEQGTIIIYGFPHTKEYLQQYIFMCYNANMNGSLFIKFDGLIGHNQTTWWYFIIPSIMHNNKYNFKIQSYNYNVTITKLIDDSILISLTDIDY